MECFLFWDSYCVYASHSDAVMKLLDASFPWEGLANMLNTLLRSYQNYSRIESDLLPVPDKNDFRPASEEFAPRGLFWSVRYFMPGWFRNKNIEDEEQYKEDALMNTEYRPERILWLGCQLAKSGKYIRYDHESHKFYMLGSGQTMDTAMEPATPSELEVDSGNESTTETAMPGSETNDCRQSPLYETIPVFYTGRDNLLKLICSSFKCSRRYAKSLARVLIRFKSHLSFPFLMTFLKGVSAVPTGSRLHIYDDDISDGFRRFWKNKLVQFVDEIAGPLLYNVGISLTLTGVHIMVLKLHNGRWKDQNLLLKVTIAICLGFFYLTMGERLSGCQIVM
jgi:hypothetical protein